MRRVQVADQDFGTNGMELKAQCQADAAETRWQRRVRSEAVERQSDGFLHDQLTMHHQ